MTINELKSLIAGIEGAQNARANKSNFVVVPCEDGVSKVSIGAVAEYKAWEAETALKAAEKAAKPAVVKGPNPEAQARRDALDAQIVAMPAFTEYTATDIYNAVKGALPSNVLVMQVGSAAKRLVAAGVLTESHRDGDKKSYYTKA